MEVNEFSRRSTINLLLDENIAILRLALKDAKYKVLSVRPGSSDDEIKDLAYQTLVITRNSQYFLDDAVHGDYDVLSLEHLKFIDPLPTRKNKTVQHIIKALRESELTTKRGTFNLILREDNNGIVSWELKELLV